jgi:hypothetical protein
VWRVSDGELVATLAGHRGGVSDVAWSAGSDYLATASDDKTLGLWDARTGALLRQLTGHTAYVFCCNFNAHSNQLVRPSKPRKAARRGFGAFAPPRSFADAAAARRSPAASTKPCGCGRCAAGAASPCCRRTATR